MNQINITIAEIDKVIDFWTKAREYYITALEEQKKVLSVEQRIENLEAELENCQDYEEWQKIQNNLINLDYRKDYKIEVIHKRNYNPVVNF